MFNSLSTRILIITLSIILILALIFQFVTEKHIEKSVLNVERKSTENLMRFLLLNLESQNKSLQFYKDNILKTYKRELKNILSFQKSRIHEIISKTKSSSIDEKYEKKRILSELRETNYGNKDYIWVSDYNSFILSHPDPKYNNTNCSKLMDIKGNYIVSSLVAKAVKNGSGYHRYWWKRLGEKNYIEKLSYGLNIPEWKWVLTTGVYTNDIEKAADIRFDTMVEEIQQVISSMAIFNTGYMFIFNGQKQMVIHPAVSLPYNLNKLRNPVTKNLIADELIKTSETPDIPFKYLWDKPGHKGKYTFAKELYVYYFKPFDWYICSSIYIEQMQTSAKQLKEIILFLMLFFIAIAVLLFAFFANTLTRPLITLMAAMKQLQHKGLSSAKIPIAGTSEIKKMGSIFNSMVKHLHNAEKELININIATSRFVPYAFLKHLGKKSIVDIKPGDHIQKKMSILFADIRSFTALSEKMTPDENFRFLNSYLSKLGPAIQSNKGFIDKYIGDEIMALFDQKADDAIKGAIAMLNSLDEYNKGRQKAGYDPIHIGIGINTGLLILGTVGEQRRMDSTVISDAVNLASRIEKLTKIYNVPLLISEYTYKNIIFPNNFCIRFIDQVKVEGKSETIKIYEVFDHDNKQNKELKLQTSELFKNAIKSYNDKEFIIASNMFRIYLKRNPSDNIAKLYLNRCKKHIYARY